MLSQDFLAVLDGAGSRDCGCVWCRIPSAAVPWVRPAADGTVVQFLRRCDVHVIMCRPLEQWEIELIAEVA